jgi:gliding motility-associated-like protein
LFVEPTPTITLASPVTICNGSSYTINPIVTGTVSATDNNTVYNWSPATNLSSSTTATTVANITSNASYTLTASNVLNYQVSETHQVLVCQQNQSITLNTIPIPTVSISGNQIICPGQTTTLTASGANSYSWNTGATSYSITVGITGYGLGVPAGGSQTLSVVGTGTNACTATASITVSDPLPSYTLTTNVDFPATICSGSSYTINAEVGTGTSYTWTPALSGIDPIVSPTVTTLYALAVSNGTCTESADFYVKVVPTPTISLTSPVYICSGTSYTLIPNAQGTYTHTLYDWSPPTYLSSITTASTVASPTNTTSYSLTATNYYYPVRIMVGGVLQNDTLFCKDTASTNISIITTPTVPVINNISVCDSNYTTLYVPSPNSTYTYTWQGPCFNGTGDSININSIGIYTVTVTNSCGAVTTQTVNVLVIGNIVAGFLTNLHFTDEEEELNNIHFSNISLGTNLNYDWSFGNGDSSTVPNPYETFNSVGVYMVSLFDSDSMHCKDTASATIIFSGNRSILAIPNSFTPNNDHVDDVFYVNAVDITNFSCQISDRWGNLLYQWNGLGGFWNGIMPNGHVFMNGNYYYLLSYSDSNGNPQSRTGIVTLKQ